MKILRNLQFAILLLICLFPSSLFAHSMDVFALVEGKTIHGKANFHDGTPAKNCDVKAFDPSGVEIGRTRTGDDGKFSLEARFRCDYRLLVDAGDGHGGEYTISAAALPADLPTHDSSTASTAQARSHPENGIENSHEHPADSANAASNSEKTLLTEIHADIDAMQEQLNDYEHRLRFRDILGGIGFIVGLAGVAYGCYYRGILRNNRQLPR